MKNIDIVIPVWNEEGNIVPLVERIDAAMRGSAISYRIIFVDDRSSDNTFAVISGLAGKYPIKLLSKLGEQGKAYSILEGISHSDAEYVAMIDGDLQYPPEALPEMLRVATENGVAVANRKKHNTSFARKFISKVQSIFIGKLLMNFDCDAQSGLKVFKRDIVQHIDLSDVKPWSFDMPLLKTALDLGYSIGSVEVEFAQRSEGLSKVNFIQTSVQIATTALKLKVKPDKTYIHHTDHEHGLHHGISYKRKRYTTHTRLPSDISALYTLVGWQKWFLFLAIFFVISGIAINPYLTILTFITILTAIYFVDMVFAAFVLLKSLHFPPELKFSDNEISRINDSDLPIYTILVPMYKEGLVLPHLMESMAKIDWPKNKLEILLLLEEDDKDTQLAAKNLDLPSNIKIIVVPDSNPKTKPKACNYGLAIAKGEYVVVYDAEDKPDPDQLKKTYLGFQNLGDEVICLQSKLNYFNPNQNWLTRFFTSEYSLWFDVILPGLQSIESIIPLGGTSNHFKTKALRKLHGWDPFNVTEDCDLGVRLFKAGYKTAIVDSTTLEEANSDAKNWIRQRSRWIKGYFQTYLVHMRNPISFFRAHGIHAVLFQLIIGMRISFMLINPFLWVTTIAYFTAYKYVGPQIESLYPAFIFYVAAITLVVGNFMYLYSYMIGCAKRGHYGLIKFVFLIPIYWVMTSVAAFVGFYQLIVKPHFWEKTDHGLHLDTSASVEVEQEHASKNIFEKIKPSNLPTGMTSGFALIMATGIANILNLLYNAYLGRALNLEDFALISLISSFLSLSAIITNSLGKTITYKSAYLLGMFGEPVKEYWKKMSNKSFLIAGLLSVLWLISIPLLQDFFKSKEALPFLLFTPVWFVAFLSSVNSGFLSGSQKFYALAAMAVGESLIKLLLAVMFVYFGKTEWVYAAIPLSLSVTLLLTYFLVSRISYSETNTTEDEDLNFPIGFFGTSVLTKLSTVAFLSVDVILAKHFLSPTEAGNYALLALNGKIVFFLGSLFAQFINPIVSKNEGAKADSQKLFYYILTGVALASYFGFVVIGLFGQEVVPLIFGEKAKGITYLLPMYTFGMASFAIATAIVTYHQVKKQYLFAFVSFAAAIFQVFAVMRGEYSVASISNTIAIVSVGYLMVILVLHVIYDSISSVLKRITGTLSIDFGSSEPRKNLRILIYNWRDTKHKWGGGAEVYIQEIAGKWVEEGHEVTMFCGNDGKNKNEENINGINIYRKGGSFGVYFWGFIYYITKFRGKFDMVVDCENGVPFFTPLYSTLPKILIIHHVHQEVFKNHLRFPMAQIGMFAERVLMPFFYKNAKVVAVSQSTKNDIVKMGWAKANEIEVINPAINHELFRKNKKSENPRFAYLGRLQHYKNIPVALSAFSNVLKKHPNARFDIAGEGESLQVLRKLAKQLGIEKSVTFHGKVSDKKRVKLLGQAWAAIQPSSFEGWGITVIEANACGTPVIASNVGGLKDSVVNGKTGYLFGLNNVENLTEFMVFLASSTRVRNEMSREAFEWSQNYTWDKSASQFFAIIVKKLTTQSKFKFDYALERSFK